MAKVYNLRGVGGSEELKLTVVKGGAFMNGGIYQTGDGYIFKKQADGIEAMIVALAASGFKMDDPKLIEAINGAVEACKNKTE